jgi:glycogen synthase kinase 3 beta
MRSSFAFASHSARKSSSRPAPAAQNGTTELRVIGQGAFGVVYCARTPEGDLVAVKKVLQDPHYKNRELEICEQIHSPYCVSLRSHFVTAGRKPNETYLNLIMDFVPMCLHEFNLGHRKERKYPPLLYVKLFAFQMFAGLHYLHSIGITHRDLKPQNILCDPQSGELKLCDFGSAKKIAPGEKSISYIASRYYRAPELILGCDDYGSSIDIWAGGCCVAEMLTAGLPFFQGNSSVGQLHAIVRILGRPKDEDLRSFPHSADIEVATSNVMTLADALPKHTPRDLLDLLKCIFVYRPARRPTALQCMKHRCFDEIFAPGLTMPDGRPFPSLDRS